MAKQQSAEQIERIPLERLIPYARNARTHSDAQVAQIAASIREFGFTNPVLIDADEGIIAGHGRVLAARKLGLAEVPCIRLAHLTPAQRRAYVIADNKLALNAGWDEDMLRLELGDLQGGGFDLELLGFTGDELEALLEGEPGQDDGSLSEYSSKIEAPTYTPKGEKPPIDALFNREKMDSLLVKIDEANIPSAEKRFLTMAAARHVVFDYHQIAEFYCHATPEVQALMEDSALVIIDFDKAIEQGYVQLSKRLAEIYGETQTENDDEEIGA